MTTTKRKINKIFAFIVIALLASLVAGLFSFTLADKLSAHAAEAALNNELGFARHIPTLADDFRDDRVIVTLKSQHSDVNRSQSFRTSESIAIDSVEDLTYITNPAVITNREAFSQIFSITLRERGKENVLRAIEELERLDHVLAAEPEYNFEVTEDWAPDDTRYNEQWGLRDANGIQAELAWDFTRGDTNPRMKVGIFETNIQANHLDLRVINGNFTPAAGADADHGSHVGGIIGAITNNDRGIAGVAQVELALLDKGSNNFANSLTWAINNNIRIVNASYFYGTAGNPSPSVTAHATAIRNFGTNGGIFIASAGNQGNGTVGNTDNTPQFPAGYGDARNFPNINNVISVGALNPNGTRRDTSNFGANSVHIYAPGGIILSTFPENRCTGATPSGIIIGGINRPSCEWDADIVPANRTANNRSSTHVDNGYHEMSGTSMAAPHVTGVAALLRTVNPNLTAVQIRDAILNNAENITIQIPNPAGGTVFEDQTVRRLNAHRAVASVAFNTSLSGSGISIDGFINGYTMPQNTSLVLPDRFARMGETVQRDVVAIGNSAFANQQNLFEITIPSTVTVIGLKAFQSCYNIESMEIPFVGDVKTNPSHTYLGYWFGSYPSYSIQGLYVPESLKAIVISGNGSIGDNAFYGCDHITSIQANAATSIGTKAFYGCSSITSIQANAATSIGISAFSGCSSLESFTINPSVTDIGDNTFKGCSSLSGTMTLPVGLTNIGNFAFSDCSSLTSINIPATVATIGTYAFCDSGLQSVDFDPNSVLETIGFGAFQGCNYLTDLTLPFVGDKLNNPTYTHLGYVFGAFSYLLQAQDDLPQGANEYIPRWLHTVKVTGGNIGNNAFYGCKSIMTITIPDNITSIGNSAFYKCSGLTTIYAGSAGSVSTFKIPKNVTSIGNRAFYGCSGLSSISFGSFGYPDQLLSIGNEAFSGCSSLGVLNTIPDTVTSIGYGAFSGCSSLWNFNMPSGITIINNDTFRDCISLTGVVIRGNITRIDEYAYAGCTGLTRIDIENTGTSIGLGAFQGCDNLGILVIPFIGDKSSNPSYTHLGYIFGTTSYANQGSTDYVPASLYNVNVTGNNIGSNAFYGCKYITYISLSSNGVTNIGDYAFYGCSGITSFYKNSTTPNIGNYAFYGCKNLTSLSSILSGAQNIGNSAFYGCSGLTGTLTIPASVTKIGDSAFYDCNKLSGTLTIPAGVKSIGDSAFKNCTGLTTVTFAANSQCTDIGNSAFYNCNKITSVSFGSNSQLTTIGDNAFYLCKLSGALTIPASVKTIGNSAFRSQSGLTSISFELNSLLQTIGDNAFNGCNGLTKFTFLNNATNFVIPGNVTSIGSYAFNGCTNLTGALTIPNNVTSIGSYAFSNCPGFTSLSIPQKVASIGEMAFYGCYLSTITVNNSNAVYKSDSNCLIRISDNLLMQGCNNSIIPSYIKSIGVYAFEGCTMPSISIPSGVMGIGNGAFANCTSLATVSFENNSLLTNIGNSAFANCYNLGSISIPSGVMNIGSGAFDNCTALSTVTFEGYSLRSIGSSAFKDCTSLTDAALPFWVNEIGSMAFSGCSDLTSVTIPYGVTKINSYTFEDCASLTDVTFETFSFFGNQLQKIEERAFYNTGLTSITLPSGLTTIGGWAFSGSALTSITIPANVTSIGGWAFLDCSDLAEVYVQRYDPSSNTPLACVGYEAFEGCDSALAIYVPAIAFNDYQNAWSNYSQSIFSGPPSMVFAPTPGLNYNSMYGNGYQYYDVSIGSADPSNNNGILYIPASYNGCPVKIANDGFAYCTDIYQVIIEPGLSVIGVNAFVDCDKLGYVSIPSSVTKIDDCAFRGCSSLWGVNIESNISLSIGYSAFEYCAFSYIILPECTTGIGSSAFYGCDNLMTVYVQRPASLGVLILYGDPFYNCPGLNVIYVPDSASVSIYKGAYGWSYYQSIIYNYGGSVSSTETVFMEHFGRYYESKAFYAYDYYATEFEFTFANSGLKKMWLYGDGMYMDVFDSSNALVAGSGYDLWLDADAYETYTVKCYGYNNAVTRLVVINDYEPGYTVDDYNDELAIDFTASLTSQPELIRFGGVSGTYRFAITLDPTYVGDYTYSFHLFTDWNYCNYYSEIYSVTDDYIDLYLNTYDHFYIAFYAYADTASCPAQFTITDLYVAETPGLEYTLCYNSYYTVSIGSADPNGIIYIPSMHEENNISLPVREIANGGFSGCSGITQVVFEGGSELNIVGVNGFIDCDGITSIALPATVQLIEYSSFRGCRSLTDITFGPNSQLYSIGGYGGSTFEYCPFTSFTIPRNVTNIACSTFYACENLTTLYVNRSAVAGWWYVPYIDGALTNAPNLSAIYVPDALSAAVYKAADGWSDYAAIIYY